MRRRSSAFAFCLASLAAACASNPVTSRPRLAVADAEIAFAADAQRRTVQEAFLTAFAPEAITFRPTPVNAHQALSARPYPPNTRLSWTPTTAETAAAGDLAVTSGPAEWGTRGEAPTGTGYFLSVWRAFGKEWKVVFDTGVEAPIPASVDRMAGTISVRTLQPSPARSDDLEQMRNDVLSMENRLIDDYPNSLREHAASDIRLFRNGQRPSATLAEAIAVTRGEDAVEWQPQAAFVSRSGDLAYVYGVASTDREAGYVRVWRNQDGNWKVAYDMR